MMTLNFELSKEQKDIVSSKGSIKINAVAGSGKTSTVYAYISQLPTNAKILYLAFNKTVKLEAEHKFKNFDNVKVETAHSLAFKNIVYRHQYKIKPNGYSTSELVKLLHIKNIGEAHSEYIIANHVLKIALMFCNSIVQKVAELAYEEIINEEESLLFYRKHKDKITHYVRVFLAEMNSGKIEIIHDFYLKKFQLDSPILNYEYVFFDEAQDASAAMLDVFMKQNAVKIIVGDEHQQIYSWRFAINSLNQASYPRFQLSNSYRFGNEIAALAQCVLDRKKLLSNSYNQIHINGLGKSKQIKTKAIIARTNLSLLLKAIEYVNEKEHIDAIYFEGNLNSYTYADEGASLYDILNLSAGKIHKIKDPLIRSLQSLEALEEYIDKTDDVQLKMMLELVNEYGYEIYDILKLLKEKHVADNERDKAQIVFSTVHKCKGMEYDQVQILHDFLTEDKLRILKQSGEVPDIKLNEEINLLYVAITRTKNTLIIPEEYLPTDFPEHKNIIVISNAKTKSAKNEIQKVTETKKTQSKSIESQTSWSLTHDRELRRMYFSGISMNDISKNLNKTKSSIAQRIKYLKLDVA
ncbi:MAG: AAA family ATPase [Cytophagales bacterium]